MGSHVLGRHPERKSLNLERVLSGLQGCLDQSVDLADALVFLMKHYSEEETINVGVGADVSILDAARQVCAAVGYTGSLAFDPSKPDGTPRKLLDVTRLSQLGWKARTPLSEGLARTYAWFLEQRTGVRGAVMSA